MTTIPTTAEEVLSFWFGDLDRDGLADDEHAARWWRADASFDDELRARFGETHAAARAGRLDGWATSARGTLALVLVLDQLSRNLHRGTREMYAADERALELALGAIDAARDHALPADPRAFLYMPLMHSESLAMQERCVELFRALHDELEGRAKKRVAGNLDYAIQHRDIVARFGRFPHRNAILGRESTEEERAFLEQPGSSF